MADVAEVRVGYYRVTERPLKQPGSGSAAGTGMLMPDRLHAGDGLPLREGSGGHPTGLRPKRVSIAAQAGYPELRQE